MVAMVMVVTLVNCMWVTVMPVTVEAIGMAGQSIDMGTPIGTVAIGVGMAIGIGGTVDGGPMVLALVGEWFLAAGFGSVTDDPRRAETLHLSEKFCPLLPTKRNECSASVFQPITVREQRHECAGLAVAVCPDHHKGGLGEALGLEPSLAAARPIGCECVAHNSSDTKSEEPRTNGRTIACMRGSRE